MVAFVLGFAGALSWHDAGRGLDAPVTPAVDEAPVSGGKLDARADSTGPWLAQSPPRAAVLAVGPTIAIPAGARPLALVPRPIPGSRAAVLARGARGPPLSS